MRVKKRAWVGYEPVVVRGLQEPIASISKESKLTLNRFATLGFQILRFKFAKLMFDPSERLIGIQLSVDKPQGHSLKVIRTKDGVVLLNLKGFLKQFGLEHDRLRQYAVTYEPDEQLLMVDLKQSRR